MFFRTCHQSSLQACPNWFSNFPCADSSSKHMSLPVSYHNFHTLYFTGFAPWHMSHQLAFSAALEWILTAGVLSIDVATLILLWRILVGWRIDFTRCIAGVFLRSSEWASDIDLAPQMDRSYDSLMQESRRDSDLTCTSGYHDRKCTCFIQSLLLFCDLICSCF